MPVVSSILSYPGSHEEIVLGLRPDEYGDEAGRGHFERISMGHMPLAQLVRAKDDPGPEMSRPTIQHIRPRSIAVA